MAEMPHASAREAETTQGMPPPGLGDGGGPDARRMAVQRKARDLNASMANPAPRLLDCSGSV
ncbi:MAG: hypothetical protein VKK97_00615, partial [Synechococcaceae cyanobacterium]|nr:hypothetical protein [Synechococcaceae cyanobacterium]